MENLNRIVFRKIVWVHFPLVWVCYCYVSIDSIIMQLDNSQQSMRRANFLCRIGRSIEKMKRATMPKATEVDIQAAVKTAYDAAVAQT